MRDRGRVYFFTEKRNIPLCSVCGLTARLTPLWRWTGSPRHSNLRPPMKASLVDFLLGRVEKGSFSCILAEPVSPETCSGSKLQIGTGAFK